MIKLTVLYGHPEDAEAFEGYYANTHIPIALKMKGHEKAELTRFMSAADGTPAAYYRMAEFWYDTPEAMLLAIESPEGQATGADLANFATGGVTFLSGRVE